MTREEAIEIFENKENYVGIQHIPGADVYISRGLAEAINVALTALRPVSREQLSEFKTCELVDELRKREGVETHIAEPYQDVTVSVNGPAMVLVVID